MSKLKVKRTKTKQVKQDFYYMTYRLVKHIGKLVLLHGRAKEGSTIFDLVEMYSLAEKYQNDETCMKYLKKHLKENTKGHHFDFDVNQIIVKEGIAFIIEENKNKTIN